MAEIKYWQPVGRAWNRMCDILFRPFNFEKWLIMGFAAWIAGLNATVGSGGGVGRSGNFANKLESSKEAIAEFWAQYGVLIISIGGAALILCIALCIAFLWLHARGKFIFLDNVIHNRAAIAEPWKKYRDQGNSLFLWNLAISFIAIVTFLLLGGICLAMLWPMCVNKSNIPLGITGVVFGILSLLIYFLFFSYLKIFVYDFIIPIMLKYNIGIRAAWNRFFVILKPNFWRFILYGLIRYLVSWGVGLALAAAYLLSCCCLMFLALIPYVGSVLLLPVFIFFRYIGLEFLRQFGDDFDVCGTVPELVTPECSEDAEQIQ